MDKAALYRLNIPLIEQAFQDSLANGIENAIVFVICSDEKSISGSLARYFNQPENGNCVFWAEATNDLASTIGIAFPRAGQAILEPPPSGQFLICIVAGDSLSVGSHPKK